MAIDTDVVNDTDAVLTQLTIDINAGKAGEYRIVQTRTYTARTASLPKTGWTVLTDDRYTVIRHDNSGKDQTIATIHLRDGNLSTVMVERGVAFELVPRALRAIA